MSWRDRAKDALQKNRGDTPLTKLPKPPFVSSVSSPPARSQPKDRDFTQEEFAELKKLLREICELEGRSDEELAELLDEAGRMAPVNVLKSLAALRIARDEAMKVWPDQPAKRAQITLCVLTSRRKEFAVIEGSGGRQDQAKTTDSGEKAA